MLEEATTGSPDPNARRNEPRHTGASLRKLPPEVLGEIFLQCLPEQCRPTATQVPLLLCQISSACRQVALGMPNLWSNLYISRQDFSTSRSPHRDSLASVALQWLSRAGTNSPLSLHFDYIDEISIQNILIPFAHRYRNLTLNLKSQFSISNGMKFLRPFLGMLPGHVDQLESLILSLSGGVKSPVTAFEIAPKLRKVSLNCATANGQTLVTARLPWSQLTHLTVAEYVSPPVWVNLMMQCTKLQRGVFNVMALRDLGAPPLGLEDRVTLHDLHDLSVLFLEGHASYFNGFHFPSLTSFRLRNHAFNFDWDDSDHLLHQLRGLRRLSLIGNAAQAQNLIDLLRRTTSLVDFEFDDLVDYSPLFHSLAYSLDEDILLPRLAEMSLYMQDVEVNRFSANAFINMANSRQSVSPLPLHVTLYFTEAYAMVMDDMREAFSHHPHLFIDLQLVDSSQTLQMGHKLGFLG